MSAQNQHQEHYRVAGLVPETTRIADSNSTNLGSFAITSITEGQIVPLGNRHAMEVDFSNIEVLASATLDKDFSTFKQQLESDSGKEKLRDALAEQPEDVRELFTASLYAIELAREFFGDEIHDKDKRDMFGWKNIDETREDTYRLKKLSETADEGVCVEYSLIVGEAMRKLGYDVQYTVGYRQDWPDEPGIYHAFLTSPDTEVIIDVFAIAETMISSKPLGLAIAPEGRSIAQNPEESIAYEDIFGRLITYSASPITV